MASEAERLLKETKNQVKALEKEVNTGERLVWLLKDMGQPVQEQQMAVDQAKRQLNKMQKGLENDKKYYNPDSTVKDEYK